MFAVVMSLPRVDVRMQIKKPSQVIRLNAPEFKPANVTRMSRKGAEQSGHPHRGESWPRLPPSLSRNALNPLQALP
jgi:hypothetical protein